MTKKLEAKVGIEVEYFVLSKSGKVVLPPSWVDTDDFPLMGEMRAEPGDSVAEVYANFVRAKLEAEDAMYGGRTVDISACRRVGLETYRKAMRACETPKGQVNDGLKNLYGINLSDFSDQIVKDGKIQGINASCGVHLHFSCRKVDEVEVEEPDYDTVDLPLKITTAPGMEGVKELFESSVHLHRLKGWTKKRTLTASASLLNKPTVEWMVRELDNHFFDRFMEGEQITKYRQKGFYELKPYGFEYRSLPATPAVMEALPEIITFCFELLKEAKKYS